MEKNIRRVFGLAAICCKLKTQMAEYYSMNQSTVGDTPPPTIILRLLFRANGAT